MEPCHESGSRIKDMWCKWIFSAHRTTHMTRHDLHFNTYKLGACFNILEEIMMLKSIYYVNNLYCKTSSMTLGWNLVDAILLCIWRPVRWLTTGLREWLWRGPARWLLRLLIWWLLTGLSTSIVVILQQRKPPLLQTTFDNWRQQIHPHAAHMQGQGRHTSGTAFSRCSQNRSQCYKICPHKLKLPCLTPLRANTQHFDTPR